MNGIHIPQSGERFQELSDPRAIILELDKIFVTRAKHQGYALNPENDPETRRQI